MKTKICFTSFLFLALLMFFSIVNADTSFDRNLSYGIKNNSDVLRLQIFLAQKGYYNGPASGNYSVSTRQAVKSFQLKNNIVPANGVFGTKTRVLVNKLISSFVKVNTSQEGTKGVQSNPPTTNSQTINPVDSDFSQVQGTYFYDYANNPPVYLGKKVKVKVTIGRDFLAAGDKGGYSNYIGTADPNVVVNTELMLNISDNSSYQKATSSLKSYDLVTVYGYGSQSLSFNINGVKTLTPVINVTRLDLIGVCGYSGCGENTSAKTLIP